MFFVALPYPSSALSVDDLPQWRFYSTSDGFREAWSYSIAIGPSGEAIVTHGSVDSMSVYDGYSIQQIPSLNSKFSARQSPNGRIWSNHWNSDLNRNYGMAYYDSEAKRWISIEIPEVQACNETLDTRFLPIADDRILILLPECLYLFQLDTQQMTPLRKAENSGIGLFSEIISSRDHGAWIAGERGIAKILPNRERYDLDTNWIEYSFGTDSDYQRIENLFEYPSNRIYGSAMKKSTGRRILLVLESGEWKGAYQSEDVSVLMGWPDIEGGLWVVTGTNNDYDLLRIIGNSEYSVKKQKVLSGYLFRVVLESNGVFWIATSMGLARHAPPLWSRPLSLMDHNGLFNSITIDNQGRLYAVNQESLMEYERGSWNIYPFPPERIPTGCFVSQGVIPLPDGQIGISTLHPDFLVFDPRQKQYHVIPHPAHHEIRVIAKRNEGGHWLVTRHPERRELFLEIMQGSDFQTVAGPILGEEAGVPRYILELDNGDVWLAGLGRNGLGSVRNGQFHSIGKAEGYDGIGAMSLLDIGDGTIWIGERDRIVETDGKNWRVVKQNLETVRKICRMQDGSVWVAAGFGVLRYFLGTWVMYDTLDNLPDAAVYDVVEDEQNRIWVATTLGMSLFYPNWDTDSPVTVMNPNNIPEVAPYGETRISFSGNDKWKYTDESHLLFSYRVDGQPWSIFLPNRDVILKRLSYGQHLFEVRAMDRAWNVDPNPARFEFTVILPWYRQTGFIIWMTLSTIIILILIANAVSRYFRLEHLVVERTQELIRSNESLQREFEQRIRSEEDKAQLQEQLIHSQKMEGIGRLAGGIAHDFNNILTAILGYSDLLEIRCKDNLESLRDLEEIKKAAQRAAALTQQLLAFSRKQVMQPKIVNLSDLVLNMEQILRRLISENIEIDTHLDSALKNIKADPTQIEQIVLNLCINARDAMPARGKLVIETVNTELTEDYANQHVDVVPGSYVLLSISDTGIGMDREVLPHIFEPFYTTKEKGKGTGLGLATVYGIIKQSGGYVWVYSEPNLGTTFKIYFPVCHDQIEPSKPVYQQETILKGTGTILLVEDETSVRQLSQRILEEAGFHVLLAADGVEALEIGRRYLEPIRLLITDVIMPKMGGKELVLQLQSIHPETKALYVSGYTENAIVKGGFLELGTQFLMKPFTPGALTQKVYEVLSS